MPFEHFYSNQSLEESDPAFRLDQGRDLSHFNEQKRAAQKLSDHSSQALEFQQNILITGANGYAHTFQYFNPIILRS